MNVPVSLLPTNKISVYFSQQIFILSITLVLNTVTDINLLN